MIMTAYRGMCCRRKNKFNFSLPLVFCRHCALRTLAPAALSLCSPGDLLAAPVPGLVPLSRVQRVSPGERPHGAGPRRAAAPVDLRRPGGGLLPAGAPPPPPSVLPAAAASSGAPSSPRLRQGAIASAEEGGAVVGGQGWQMSSLIRIYLLRSYG